MIEQFIRYVAGLLASILEKYADPLLQSKLDAYNAKIAAAEQKEKEAGQLALQSESAYNESVAKRTEYEKQLQLSLLQEKLWQQRIKDSQDRIQQLRDTQIKQAAEIQKLSDHDAVRGDV